MCALVYLMCKLASMICYMLVLRSCRFSHTSDSEWETCCGWETVLCTWRMV